MEEKYIISVIITAYNAENSIKRAINSVLNTPEYEAIEIVVVDDCSKDNTYNEVKELVSRYRNVRLLQMEKNSGGPSGPRNLGVSKATGEYITFLDDDDEINADHLLAMVRQVKEEEADFGKGYLIAVNGENKSIHNRLPICERDKNKVIRDIVAQQSMNSDFIVERKKILELGVRYDEKLKIGEDTVFITELMCKCNKPIYLDNYFLIHYNNPQNISNLSSTQNWSDKEITQQIQAWTRAEKNLSGIGISYFKLRLPATFRNLMMSIVRYSNGITEETYRLLNEFACSTKVYIEKSMNLSMRYNELYKAILSGNYDKYCYMAKRRLLINGYDLKFVLPLVKYLEKDFNIKVDEWKGHNLHDQKQSEELLAWADIIWCEWMLGNAEFYSKRKHKHQRVIIRAHRFELYREFGNNIDWNKVDMVFTVGYYYFEQFIERFNIPRGKMHLLSNYIEDSIYDTDKNDGYRFNVGLVGILPKRKGYLKGLEILDKLVKKDSRYKLYIMGKNFDKVDWIKNNPAEKNYFEECERYIVEHGLEEHVIYGGFVEREKLYGNLGYVLSLSDSEAPESFHLAPAEAACSGSMGMLLNWPGVEYIYPQDVVYEDIGKIADDIYKATFDDEYYVQKVQTLRKYVLDNYSLEKFLKILEYYLVHIRIEG